MVSVELSMKKQLLSARQKHLYLGILISQVRDTQTTVDISILGSLLRLARANFSLLVHESLIVQFLTMTMCHHFLTHLLGRHTPTLCCKESDWCYNNICHTTIEIKKRENEIRGVGIQKRSLSKRDDFCQNVKCPWSWRAVCGSDGLTNKVSTIWLEQDRFQAYQVKSDRLEFGDSVVLAPRRNDPRADKAGRPFLTIGLVSLAIRYELNHCTDDATIRSFGRDCAQFKIT